MGGCFQEVAYHHSLAIGDLQWSFPCGCLMMHGDIPEMGPGCSIDKNSIDV